MATTDSVHLMAPMDRRQIEEGILMTERHIAQGQRHIARQVEIIEELVRGGHDTAEARRLLSNFEQSQELHISHRDRLLNELAASPKIG